jgi:hypothetical protein
MVTPTGTGTHIRCPRCWRLGPWAIPGRLSGGGARRVYCSTECRVGAADEPRCSVEGCSQPAATISNALGDRCRPHAAQDIEARYDRDIAWARGCHQRGDHFRAELATAAAGKTRRQALRALGEDETVVADAANDNDGPGPRWPANVKVLCGEHPAFTGLCEAQHPMHYGPAPSRTEDDPTMLELPAIVVDDDDAAEVA